MKIRFRHLPLVFLGALLIWIKYPSTFYGFGEIFFSWILGIYLIYFGILIIISLDRSIKQNKKFDFISCIISGFIFTTLLTIYMIDDIDRLQILIESSGVNCGGGSTARNNCGYFLNLCEKDKYRLMHLWPEGGCHFEGKFKIVGDTLLLDNEIEDKTESVISGKYLIDLKSHSLYYFDSKINKIDSSARFVIDTLRNYYPDLIFNQSILPNKH